jgi:phage gpG-like protein
MITIDTSELTEFLKSLGARLEKGFDSRKALLESGRLIASLIKTRTKSGKDADGKPFAPYKGRGGRVDLDASGEMLGAIEVRLVSDTEAVVGIFDPVQARKAVIHQMGLGKMPARRFFGLGRDAAGVTAEIGAIFARELGKATGKI